MSAPKEESRSRTKRPSSRSRRRFPRGGPTRAEVKKLREALLHLRAAILRSNRNLAEEALKGSGQDFSVDHMADHGTDNFEQDFSLSLLEGESEIFRDIQDALEKIDGRGELPYGICETCAETWGQPEHEEPESPWIPKGRLQAVPYARLCVLHKEREEQGLE